MPEKEPGDRPNDIDFDAIFAGDAESPPSEGARGEDIQKSTVVEKAVHDVEVMRTGFNTNESVPEHIQRTMTQLGSFSKWLYSRDAQKMTREHILRLSKELFEYQYQDMQHLLMLGMDVQKKRRFVQYLDATGEIQDRIQKQSAQSQAEINATYFANAINEFKRKNNRDIELKELRAKGALDQKQFARLREENEVMTEEIIKRLAETARTMLTRHAEFLFETLKLFKSNLLTEGKI